MERRCVISPASLKIFISTTCACLRYLVVLYFAANSLINSLAFLTTSFNHVFASFAAFNRISMCCARQSSFFTI